MSTRKVWNVHLSGFLSIRLNGVLARQIALFLNDNLCTSTPTAPTFLYCTYILHSTEVYVPVGVGHDASGGRSRSAVSNRSWPKAVKRRTTRWESILLFIRRLFWTLHVYCPWLLLPHTSSFECPYGPNMFHIREKFDKSAPLCTKTILSTYLQGSLGVCVPVTTVVCIDLVFRVGIGSNRSRIVRAHPFVLA